MTPSQLTCKSCFFWERAFEKSDLGYCHRNPPVQVGMMMATWPRTGDLWWCGEHHYDKDKGA